MKKKGPRGIPDFSSKRKSAPIPGATELKPHPAPQVADRNVKPVATSVKSGRRGQ